LSKHIHFYKSHIDKLTTVLLTGDGKKLSDVWYNSTLPDDGSGWPETCSSWRIETLLLFWWVTCIGWFTLW